MSSTTASLPSHEFDACASSIFARTSSWRCFWARSVAIALLPSPERFSASFQHRLNLVLDLVDRPHSFD